MGHDTLAGLAQDRDVRRSAAFRAVAQGLDSETLTRLFRQEAELAPRRSAAGKPYFAARDGTLPKRGARRDEDRLAIALVNHARERAQPLRLPPRLSGDDAGTLEILDYHIPLRPPGASGAGPDRVDLIGIGPGGRLAVVVLRWIAPSAARGATGDTPLRALLEGLAACAALEGDREAVQAEAEAAFGRRFAAEPPLLYLLGSPRYWELSRRREAQKGAAWIQQMERLARALETGEGPPAADDADSTALGIGVRYLGLALEGDPPWDVRDERPVLLSAPRITTAWESTAGRIKPKARPRPRTAPSEPVVVEADLNRPMRAYDVKARYAAGDRIEHPTLGVGVVQGLAGPAKIAVLFDGVKRVLVHERPSGPA